MDLGLLLILVILLVNSAWLMTRLDRITKLLESIESKTADTKQSDSKKG